MTEGTADDQKRKRCPICNARLKAHEVAFTCKCNHTFCSKHRLAEDHGCTFDHKTLYAEKIIAENPRVIAPKVIAI